MTVSTDMPEFMAKPPADSTEQAAILGARVKLAREAKGLTQTQLGEIVGMRQTGIGSIESGEVSRPRKLREIARALGVTQEWLLGEGEPPDLIGTDGGLPHAHETVNVPASNASSPSVVEFPRRKLPIYGHAAGGMADDGRFILNGQMVAEVFCPPSLESVKGAYAVYVHGYSMSPRYEPGEILYVHPSLPVRRGDYVVIQLHGERGEPPLGFVKKFISRNADFLTLEQLNPPEGEANTIKLPSARVISIHKVVGSASP